MAYKPKTLTAFRTNPKEMQTLARLAKKLRTTKTDVIKQGIQLLANQHLA